MFKLQKHTKPSKLREKIDFNFSNFQALQVPKGWDKLFVSLISVATGKTIVKSSKALVRSGHCQWTETLSESIWISQDDSSNYAEECLFKLLVSTGSARSGILGEATVNMAQYMTSRASASVSLPLKKCNYGTTLQVKIHCLTPRTRLRDEDSNSSNSHAEHQDADCHDMGRKSNGSGGSLARSLSSQSSKYLDSSSYSRKVGTMNLMEAADDTTEEIHNEVKTWERNSRKLALELDILRKKFSDQSKKQADLEIKFSAACIERDGVNKKIEQMKSLLEESMVKQADNVRIQKELENEIKFQEELNASLALQLQRNQESNIELVSVLQELEQTTERQKLEIENLSTVRLKFDDLEKSVHGNLEENRSLLLQLQQFQKSEKTLQDNIQLLEQALERKNNELENERSLNSQSLLDIEREYKSKLTVKEEETVRLEAKLSDIGRHLEETGPTNESGGDLIRDIEAMKEKMQELERDCCELTDENLELLWKLKESKNNYIGGSASFDTSSSEIPAKSFASIGSEFEELKSQIYHLEDELKKKELKTSQLLYNISIHLETIFHHVKKPWYNMSIDVSNRERCYLDKLANENKTDTIATEFRAESIINCFIELDKLLEARINDCAEILKSDEIEIKDRNNTIAEIQKQLEYYILANKNLERKSTELETGRCDLEVHLFQVDQENMKLLEHIASLEDQLRYVTGERESISDELEDSKSVAIGLQDEIRRLATDTERKVDLEQKICEMENRWSKAQEECEYLKVANKKLQASADGLIEECDILQKSNEEVRKKKLELHERCTLLETDLGASQRSLSDYSKRVEALEENLSAMLEDFAVKEKRIILELDALLQEIEKQKEKHILENSLLNQKYLEKTAKVENLEREVEYLTKQISITRGERERIASEAVHEVSSLRADRDRLESALQEVHSRVKFTEDEVLDLKRNLNDCKLEKGKLEASLHSMSGDYEELTVEKISLVEKIYSLQKAMPEFEECKKKTIVLEEKLLQMKSDLTAKEALCVQDAKLINELSQIKKANKKYQLRIQQLEEDKDGCLKRTQALEEDLRLMEAKKQDRSTSAGRKNKIVKSTNHDLDSRRKASAKTRQVRELLADQQNPHESRHQRGGENEYGSHNGNSHAVGGHHIAKIQLLESELAEALEANNKYKIELQRLLSEGQNGSAAVRKSMPEVEVVAKEKYERIKSSLETELLDLRDRYLQMSLKYAEVEAQRENLVMKLKASKSSKRWFS